jgi:hypothetical protein
MLKERSCSGHDGSLVDVFALTFGVFKDDDSPSDRRSAAGGHGDGGVGRVTDSF